MYGKLALPSSPICHIQLRPCSKIPNVVKQAFWSVLGLVHGPGIPATLKAGRLQIQGKPGQLSVTCLKIKKNKKEEEEVTETSQWYLSKMYYIL